MFAFLLVFVRCSAMFLTSPVFGSNSTPVQIRVFTALSLSGAIGFLVKPAVGPIPPNIAALLIVLGSEVATGLLIGAMMNLVIQAAQMAGAILDIQVGLSTSQVLNPFDGISATVLSQFKFMLATVIFLTTDAHHFLIRSLVESYNVRGGVSALSFATLQSGCIQVLSESCILAIQIAAPTLAVSMVVDASLGLISRAVPQMQAMNVGMPAKVGAGILAVSVSLPPLVSATMTGTGMVFNMFHLWFNK